MLSRLNRFWSKFQINFPCCCSVSNCLTLLLLNVCAILWSAGPRSNSRISRTTTPPSLCRAKPLCHPTHHLYVQQITVLPPPSSQTGSRISHAPLRRDLASAQVKPAILGPEIGLEVRSILEHLLHPTQPLTIHHLPALPDNHPIPTTSLLNFYGFPANTRVRVCTHKSTVS
jgi:hypothetical protein